MGFGDGSANSQEGTPSADGSPGPDMVLEVRSRPASPDFNVLREVRAFDPDSEKLVSAGPAAFHKEGRTKLQLLLERLCIDIVGTASVDVDIEIFGLEIR